MSVAGASIKSIWREKLPCSAPQILAEKSSISTCFIQSGTKNNGENKEILMAVVTISRQYGSGGKTLGKLLADKLNYIFADSDIIQRIAREANVSTDWVTSFEHEADSRVSRVVSKMVSQPPADRVSKSKRGYLNEKIYIDYLVLIIAQIADEGDAVIMGRGSQYVLNDHPDAYHVLLINDVENRTEFLKKNYKLSERQAIQMINSEDRRRSILYRKLGKQDYDSPSLYHLVLNMGRLEMEAAVDLIYHLVKI
ncbi:MAG: cytidylate kinase-like family protein [Deltaproteobacteria bacterium]|nr:MAG: cytidylate kinase-like family protein [Deltaproteobacteria bacterium]